MKVSIITSCFNREATIAHAIESVLAQDYPDIEYIVVDGASRDRSLQVIERYSDRITRIISEPDSGMYEGITKGWRRAISWGCCIRMISFMLRISSAGL